MKTLSNLLPGECAVISHIEESSKLRRRFFDLGIVPGTYIKCVLKSVFSDPCAYLVRDSVIAIRKCDAKDIVLNKG